MKPLCFIFLISLPFWSFANPVVIFVHGAWGGGWDYQHISSLLKAKGYKVYRPTLTGLGERYHLSTADIDLNTHITDIINVIKFEDLNEIILVGHSYGGMVISGVAEQLPERIKHLLYLDAILPLDGESVFSTMPIEEADFLKKLAKNHQAQQWTIPPYWPIWGKDVPHPIATFEQAISLKNNKAKTIPASYVLTIEPGKTEDDFMLFGKRAKSLGMAYFELKAGHNVHRTMPNEIIAIIDDINRVKQN